jgi:general secretion pathway protein D/MSHA biogenesis protein MshL
MLVVGGLISETESKDGNTIIPGTQDIPYLKYLFGYEEKSKSKSELIILLRPRIIN